MKSAFQVSKYSLVAIGSAVTDYAAFTVFVLVGVNVVLAQALARILGGVFSFITNKYWSFESRRAQQVLTEGRRFLLVYVLSFATSISLVYFMSTYFGFKPYPAKITADSICFCLNFVLLKRYVFSDRRGLLSAIKTFFESRQA